MIQHMIRHADELIRKIDGRPKHCAPERDRIENARFVKKLRKYADLFDDVMNVYFNEKHVGQTFLYFVTMKMHMEGEL